MEEQKTKVEEPKKKTFEEEIKDKNELELKGMLFDINNAILNLQNNGKLILEKINNKNKQ